MDSHKFWGEIILHATYILNRFPTPVVKWGTPYERLYNKKANLSLLKVFGTLYYASNTNPHKGKLEPRASNCIYIGVGARQKGFKVFSFGF